MFVVVVGWSRECGSSGLNDDDVLVQLALVLGLESKEGLFREPWIGLLAGVWEAEEPGRSKESVDALGSVLCKNALNESLIVGVSVYHIERDFSGVGVSDPCNLDGDWG